MYTSKLNQVLNQDEILSFMKRFSFATIISNVDEVPQATHLPFTITCKDGEILLHAHFARANKQWENIEAQKVLVIFSEPHAYVSPKHYNKVESVPTWNYYAVHAYGNCEIIYDRFTVVRALEDMITIYEPEYKLQWDTLSGNFKDKMLQGIVAFTVTVTDLQASQKLSQNKTVEEQQRIIYSLCNSDDTNAKITGEYMKYNLGKKH